MLDVPWTVDQYCDWMQTEGVWGGELELYALAYHMKFNVIIHRNGSPPIPLLVSDHDEYMGVVHLSHHMGERWGSIRRGDDPIMTKQVPIKDYPIWYDTAKC